MEYPLPERDKAIIENTGFSGLKARVFRGGLPIFTKARVDTPIQGEIWLENIGSSASLFTYVNGVKYKI